MKTYHILKLVLCLILLLSLSSCGKVTYKAKGLQVGPGTISGVVTPFADLVVDNNQSFLISNAYAACSSASASIYGLNNLGNMENTPMATVALDRTGRWIFSKTALGLLQGSTIKYVIVASGCGEQYSRLITALDNNQTVDVKTTAVTMALTADTPITIGQISTTSVTTFTAQLTGDTIYDVFDQIAATPALTTSLNTMVGSTTAVATIQTSAPKISSTNIPTPITQGTASLYQVTAFHMDRTYQFGYEWLVGDTLSSTASSFSYTPATAGNKSLTLRVGWKKAVVGGVVIDDTTKPYYEKIYTIAVNPGVGDTIAPVVEITGPSNALINSTSSAVFTANYTDANAVTVNLSPEGITQETTGDVSCTMNVASTTITFSECSGNGTVRIKVNAGTGQDSAGNLNIASEWSSIFTVDNTPPTVEFSSGPSDASIDSSGSTVFQATYTGGHIYDTTVSQATASGDATCATVTVANGNTATPSITLSGCTGSGTVHIKVDAGSAQDQAGNLSTASAWSSTFTVVENISIGASNLSLVPIIGNVFIRSPTAEFGHSATLLANGKVLVVGGYGRWTGVLASVELYDPSLNTWTEVASLNVARQDHTATLLANGKVLVVGGQDGGWNSISSVELYDPALNTWTEVASLNAARSGHSATLLANGKVLLVGGDDINRTTIASALLYDPNLNTWTEVASLNTGRYGHTATRLANGKVLVIGGGYNCAGPHLPIASVELYDPALNTWTEVASLNAARQEHTATLLANGKVLVLGGMDINMTTIASVELYDPSLNTWTEMASLNTGRYGHSATLLANGKVLVVGGDSSQFMGASVELYDPDLIYDPDLSIWTEMASLTTARRDHSITLFADGKVLVVGGGDSNSHALASVELYDPNLNTWTEMASPDAARSGHSATLLANGKVLVVGGDDINWTALASALLYDPALNTWTEVASLNTGRHGHSATLLANGKVLVIGGGYCGAGPYVTIASVELYDPALNTWTEVASPNVARHDHSATLLANGKVLVVGGDYGDSTALLYDPDLNTWTEMASLNTGRHGHSATLLANGKVLVLGGEDGNGYSIASVELYDPDLNTWTETETPNARRFSHSATLLANGKVLVVGGGTSISLTSSSVGLYSLFKIIPASAFNVSGGTAPYVFESLNQLGYFDSQNNFSPFMAGTLNFKVTDADGNTSTKSIEVQE